MNVAFEVTGRFAEGLYAEYASGTAVMNWLVVGLKVLGAVVAEAAAMATGLAGDASRIDLAGIAYLVGFLLAATGYGVLAVSYSRRHRTGRRAVVAGVLGAPLLLAVVLWLVPALLAVLGVMPSV